MPGTHCCSHMSRCVSSHLIYARWEGKDDLESQALIAPLHQSHDLPVDATWQHHSFAQPSSMVLYIDGYDW